jgi:hypothetical protein
MSLLASGRAWVRSRCSKRLFSFHSPLPVEESLARLTAELQPRDALAMGPYGFRGWVSESRVSVSAMVNLRQNSFRWTFLGEVVPDGTGSRLVGSVGNIAGLFILWPVFVVATVALLYLIPQGVGSAVSGHGLKDLIFILFPILAAAMVCMFVEGGFRISRDEWLKAEEWLRALLEAEPVGA